MRNTTKRSYIIIALIAVFFVLLGVLLYRFISYGDEWATKNFNAHVYSNGVLNVAGTIYDRDGEVLVSTEDGKRVYNDNFDTRISTLHVVGDSANYIATGVQKLYQASLIGYNFVDGIYNTIKSDKGSDIHLTIDSQVSDAAYKALKGHKGTISVYNYETGEVICMASAPTYDPMNKPTDAINSGDKKYEGVYLNRAISGVFTPGSTFKVVTGICAIENIKDLKSRTFECKGYYTTKSGDKVICNGTHGKVNFERALNVSCNSAFAELAIELGPKKLTQTVRDLGFSKSINVSKAATVKSSFDVSKAVDIDLGWAGIGQYTTLINPTQMLMLMGAIANSGTAITPYTVEKSAELIDYKSVENSNVNLNAQTADYMASLLRSNVKNYYTDSKFPNLQMCGKTGTAQVIGDEPHAWFVGFSQKKNFPYAIVVCMENTGYGFNNAVPAANSVMQVVLEELYQK